MEILLCLLAALLAGILVNDQWIVDGAVHMALRLGLSQSLVGARYL
ncbi:MAG: hypothetical protein R6U38_11985 [Desulfatiglandaceae bacterium]